MLPEATLEELIEKLSHPKKMETAKTETKK
jgi:hypothetical protein